MASRRCRRRGIIDRLPDASLNDLQLTTLRSATQVKWQNTPLFYISCGQRDVMPTILIPNITSSLPAYRSIIVAGSYRQMIWFCRVQHGQPISPYTMRNIPTITQRRRRTKVRAEVTPSPVGVEIVMDVQPSPPSPRPAIQEPFFTKILVSMALAI